MFSPLLHILKSSNIFLVDYFLQPVINGEVEEGEMNLGTFIVINIYALR